LHTNTRDTVGQRDGRKGELFLYFSFLLLLIDFTTVKVTPIYRRRRPSEDIKTLPLSPIWFSPHRFGHMDLTEIYFD
jgi:hypothetical protein